MEGVCFWKEQFRRPRGGTPASASVAHPTGLLLLVGSGYALSLGGAGPRGKTQEGPQRPSFPATSLPCPSSVPPSSGTLCPWFHLTSPLLSPNLGHAFRNCLGQRDLGSFWRVQVCGGQGWGVESG